MASPKRPPAPPTIAARLKHARELRGAGVSTLALDAGLSGAAVHFIENHPESDVKVSTALALAHRLDIHPAWLTYGTGPMEPFPPEIPAPLQKIRGGSHENETAAADAAPKNATALKAQKRLSSVGFRGAQTNRPK
ncbi:MAG: hypothetical protein JWM10_1925 [Myxococcaceae bacterium]|nr:hypothetical protein [Myxococcaceae bacterium]